MPQVSYVCPSLRQKTDAFRGGLASRWEEAIRHGCDYCEITAGFICSPAEEEATGLPMHAMLTPAAIASLYDEGHHLPDGIRYLLNTEYSFPHTDRFGKRHPAAVLRWDDRVWLTEFVEMLVLISDQLGRPADAIVVHPGKAHGVTFSAIARAMRFIRNTCADACGTAPVVLMQNAYPSLIRTGDDIREFWLAMQAQVPECCSECGILLDTSALSAAAHYAKTPVSSFLAPLPADALKGFFLRPDIGDGNSVIPWESIFRAIQMLPHDALIIPDVRHPDEIDEMLARCRQLYVRAEGR
ncbi:apurinic/apyrimidinic endonuclease family protein [Methanogenium organophilum]|uniref:Xylose isomerase-like TIM barrel domain-containing protein n=1 Tax=Methanogenium organophilum TaxID=2199 RepID=A0A9X9S2B7_METOG|nr:hypothetical protein [Methanogenium organophilum]WAI00559.1 hypothetical protein OU421_08975 [Methanogenium organophilum]